MLFVKAIQNLTIEGAVQLDNPTRKQLNLLVREEVETEEFIANQIISVGEYLEKPISMLKACQLVSDLIEKYWYFTLNDVLLFLKRGRQGQYNEEGQIATQFNPQTVLMWAGKYEIERTEYISKERVKENQTRKSEPITELPQDLYKGAVYNPEKDSKQKRDSEYNAYKVQYAYHKANGTLDQFLNLKPHEQEN